MKTYICSEILTQLSLFALIMLIINNKVLSKSIKSELIMTSLLIMMCAVAEFVGVIFDRGIATSVSVHTFAKYSELCLTPVVPIMLTKVFYSVKSKKIAFIPSIINIVLQTLSLVFGFIFYVDNDNIYHHGKFYWLYFFFIFTNILYLSYVTVKFGKKLQNRSYIPLFVILVFVLTGTVFQATDSNIKIVWLTVAMGMLLFYIYYCNMVYQVDSMTELLNRRAYEINKSLLKKRAYIIFFDVNNFKSINDKFGHDVGDCCLKCVASAIRKTYDKNGLCYRIGGDEFCVIIDKKTHSCNIEMLNEQFANLLSTKSCNNVAIPSVAIGYAIFNPKSTELSGTIRYADEQMYLNKNQNKYRQ